MLACRDGSPRQRDFAEVFDCGVPSKFLGRRKHDAGVYTTAAILPAVTVANQSAARLFLENSPAVTGAANSADGGLFPRVRSREAKPSRPGLPASRNEARIARQQQADAATSFPDRDSNASGQALTADAYSTKISPRNCEGTCWHAARATARAEACWTVAHVAYLMSRVLGKHDTGAKCRNADLAAQTGV